MKYQMAPYISLTGNIQVFMSHKIPLDFIYTPYKAKMYTLAAKCMHRLALSILLSY